MVEPTRAVKFTKSCIFVQNYLKENLSAIYDCILSSHTVNHAQLKMLEATEAEMHNRKSHADHSTIVLALKSFDPERAGPLHSQPTDLDMLNYMEDLLSELEGLALRARKDAIADLIACAKRATEREINHR